MAPATEAEELAALDKALTALGFTDDAKLERVLHVLTPRVVEQMASAHASTKRKAMEILSHVNKRVAAQPSMKLPLEDLMSLYVDEQKRHENNPIVTNVALVYVERAFERADAKTRAAQIARALVGVSARSAPHREIIARAAVAALAVPEKELADETNTHEVNAMAFLRDPEDRRAFLQHCLDYLLYQPNAAGLAPAAPAPSPAAAAMRGVANVAGVVTEPPSAEPDARDATRAPPPPGMSPASVARVLGPSAKPPATRELAAKKLALLHFFRRASDATVPPPELLMHYLVASCDADHEVSKLGDDLLRRRCVWDTNRPSVNLEDPKIAGSLYRAFLGGDPSVPEASRAAPASPAMKIKLVNLLCRSVTAANSFPLTVQTIFTCLYGEGTTTRLKAAGMELAVWVLRHATDAQLKQASPLLLSGMLKLLDAGAAGGATGASGGGAAATAGGEGSAPDGGTEASAGAAASTGASNVTAGVASLRGFCYQALGQLSARTPALVTGSADIAARVFGALASEPESVRASVQGAARALARAYKGCGGGVAMAIEGLLLSSIDASASGGSLLSSGAENSRRLVAAQWARELFPFDHVPARYLCVVAAGDAKADVREEGRAGLRPPGEEEELSARRAPAGRLASDESASSLTERAETFSDAKSATRNALPSATAVLAYLRTQHPELGKPAALTARLPLPPLAMSAALAFVKRCVAEETGTNPERVRRAGGVPPVPRARVGESRAPGTHRGGGGGAAGARGAVPGDVRGARGRGGGRRARPALRRARRRADAPRRREAVRRARAAAAPGARRGGGAPRRAAGAGGRGRRGRGRVLGRPRRRVRRRARPVRAPGRRAPRRRLRRRVRRGRGRGRLDVPPRDDRARARRVCRRRRVQEPHAGGHRRGGHRARRARGPAPPSPRARLRNRSRNREGDEPPARARGDRGPGRRASAEGDAPERRRRGAARGARGGVRRRRRMRVARRREAPGRPVQDEQAQERRDAAGGGRGAVLRVRRGRAERGGRVVRLVHHPGGRQQAPPRGRRGGG
jgi:hypothetical protein